MEGLFSQVRGDLVKVLKRLTPRISSFDGVIIETTGLADPAPVAQTFFVDEDIQPLEHDLCRWIYDELGLFRLIFCGFLDDFGSFWILLVGFGRFLKGHELVEFHKVIHSRPRKVYKLDGALVHEKFPGLPGIITVVDCKHIVQHLREEKPAGVENECVEQIAFSDRIILNKTDLVDAATMELVEKEVKKINGSVEMIRSQYSKVGGGFEAVAVAMTSRLACVSSRFEVGKHQVEPKKLININAFSLDRVLEMDPEFMNHRRRADLAVGCCFILILAYSGASRPDFYLQG